jgi:putative membrane protein
MKHACLITATLLLAACGNGADKTDGSAPSGDGTASGIMAQPVEQTPPAGTPATPTDAAGYIAKAGAGDLWEIESSKALLAKSGNADVKKFAQMMIDNHSKSTAKVKAAASAAGVEAAPPKLDTDQQKMLDEIKAADAAGIDAVYLRHQRTAHDAALALHNAYATNGDTDALKKAASEIVPVVEAHHTELDKLAAR